ncbi:hypothetical protein R5R35_013950 [Gryllus longicercus]|uniref:Uncharacterized protein n=1 Tax=Gryllus longicercus TaxID=2509291 RepID=A0AAN9VAT0_9ORTH
MSARQTHVPSSQPRVECLEDPANVSGSQSRGKGTKQQKLYRRSVGGSLSDSSGSVAHQECESPVCVHVYVPTKNIPLADF